MRTSLHYGSYDDSVYSDSVAQWQSAAVEGDESEPTDDPELDLAQLVDEIIGLDDPEENPPDE